MAYDFYLKHKVSGWKDSLIRVIYFFLFVITLSLLLTFVTEITKSDSSILLKIIYVLVMVVIVTLFFKNIQIVKTKEIKISWNYFFRSGFCADI